MQSEVVRSTCQIAWAARVRKSFETSMQTEHRAALNKTEFDDLSVHQHTLAVEPILHDAVGNGRHEGVLCDKRECDHAQVFMTPSSRGRQHLRVG